MRLSTPALLLGFALAAQPGEAAAQVDGHLDAGSGTMHSGSESPFGILRIAPSLSITSRFFSLASEGEFAGHTEHGWQSNGHLLALGRLTLARSLAAQLRVEGGASRTRWGRSAAGWLGGARLQLGTPDQGLALGLGSGNSFTAGASQPLSRIEAGGWSRIGRVDFGFWLKRTGLSAPGGHMTTDDRTPVDTLQLGGASRRTIQDHYTDIEASVGWTRGNLALEAGAGRRFGKAFQYTSWHLRAQYQVTPHLALVAMSGQYPVDVVSGLPSGGFTTLSMRFNLRNDPPARPLESRMQRPSGLAFSALPVTDGTHLIAVRVPGAGTVELMGDFTDWLPVLLVPGDDDLWHLRMRIPAGLHEVNLRVNGGRWTVPPGLTAVDDGLGGSVGIFTLQ